MVRRSPRKLAPGDAEASVKPVDKAHARQLEANEGPVLYRSPEQASGKCKPCRAALRPAEPMRQREFCRPRSKTRSKSCRLRPDTPDFQRGMKEWVRATVPPKQQTEYRHCQHPVSPLVGTGKSAAARGFVKTSCSLSRGGKLSAGLFPCKEMGECRTGDFEAECPGAFKAEWIEMQLGKINQFLRHDA